MFVDDYKEFAFWTEGDDVAFKNKKSELLSMFCDYHSMDPAQLIHEVEMAKDMPVDEDGLWCSAHVASQRLQQFYANLTQPESMGGQGYEVADADNLWPIIRSFYTKYGVMTDVESMASWEDCPVIEYIRRLPFGEWDWSKA